MFVFMCDEGLLYHPKMATKEHGYFVESSKLEIAENKTGAFEFTLPCTHPLFGQIRKRITEVWVLDDGEEIFRGQVLDSKGDFDNNEVVICEGLKGLLRNVHLRPYEAEDYGGDSDGFLQMCVDTYNAHLQQGGREFRLASGARSVAVEIENNDYEKILDAIDNKLLKEYGGILTVTRENDLNVISYIDESSAPMSDQVIAFGVNMLDLNKKISTKELYTVVVPLGKSDGDNGKLTIKSENGGKDYLKSTSVATYGRIERVENYSEIEDPAELMAKGQALLAAAGQTITQLEVSAVDLTLAGVNVSKLRLSHRNEVYAPTYGTDSVMRLVKITMDPLRGDDAKYAFSAEMETMTQKQTAAARDAAAVNERVSNAQQTAAAAMNKAAAAATPAQVAADIAAATSPLEINVSIAGSVMTCDKTVSQFAAAVDAGRTVIVINGANRFSVLGGYSCSGGAYSCRITIAATGAQYAASGLAATDTMVLNAA